MESISRFVPGFLGKEESLEEINGSFPTFTRPEVFEPGMRVVSAHAGAGATKSGRTLAKKKIPKKRAKTWRVPKVLLSGDQKKVKEWRGSAALE
jgi:tRNA G37 N-methylase TrmD